ncbi:MAG: ParA family protein, partial [Hyphomicrobiaceae bacterium]
MQERMRLMIRSFDGCYDRVVIDCAPGLSQLVWGALKAADLALIPYIPDRTAEDNVGWLAGRLAEVAQTPFRTVPNRVSGQDRRAEGIIAALAEQFPSLDVRIPATQALATALDFREPAGSLASKFTRATDHVSRLVDAVLELPECLATEAA